VCWLTLLFPSHKLDVCVQVHTIRAIDQKILIIPLFFQVYDSDVQQRGTPWRGKTFPDGLYREAFIFLPSLQLRSALTSKILEQPKDQPKSLSRYYSSPYAEQVGSPCLSHLSGIFLLWLLSP
jgi:hypothetical protein